MSIEILNKPQGMTPLQLVDKYKGDYPGSPRPISYAGRLDPMAEGVMVLLTGDTNKERKKYERMSKTYEFDCLFGVETDTYDDLGIITNFNVVSLKKLLSNGIQNELKKFEGTWEQEYPPYSSAKVSGKPLFWWARHKRLSEIEIPSKEVSVSVIKLIKTFKLSSKELLKYVLARIERVDGDFRQDEIKNVWTEKIDNDAQYEFLVARIFVSSSTGLYVRSLCNELGGIAIKIKRLSVGEFSM